MQKLLMRIAILDDDMDSVNHLKELIHRYEEENDISMTVSSFTDSGEFLFDYKPLYDVIFLDVQMPKYNGLQVADEIRKKDKNVFLIFQTRFGQFALQGYQFDALDYFVKPVSYQALRMRLSMIKKRLSEQKGMLTLSIDGGHLRILSLSDILYVEESGRNQIFHTTDKTEYTNSKREGLQALEERIGKYGFARCNSGFLLNLSKITQIVKNEVFIQENSFQLSRSFRKSFFKSLNGILSGD